MFCNGHWKLTHSFKTIDLARTYQKAPTLGGEIHYKVHATSLNCNRLRYKCSRLSRFSTQSFNTFHLYSDYSHRFTQARCASSSSWASKCRSFIAESDMSVVLKISQVVFRFLRKWAWRAVGSAAVTAFCSTSLSTSKNSSCWESLTVSSGGRWGKESPWKFRAFCSTLKRPACDLVATCCAWMPRWWYHRRQCRGARCSIPYHSARSKAFEAAYVCHIKGCKKLGL